MDPLSDLLRAVRLNGAFFYGVEATDPWSVSSGPAAELIPQVLPDVEHLIPYHILTSGTCWAGLRGEKQILMHAGDAIVFPQGDPHFISSGEGHHVKHHVYNDTPKRYPATVYLGHGGGERATFVCGYLGCDLRPYNPLVWALPRRMHIRGIARGWLAEFPREVVAESQLGRVGSETKLTRMAELMFIEVVRRQLESLPPQQTGWLAGLRDPIVAPALAHMHERPAHPWTLAELARAIATSRTVLAERFSQLVGVPPMQYLTQWRLQLAAEQLVRGSDKVSAIGARVGYESEAAFSRAFKRATGHAPATWRRARRHAV
jgi:AraC-like DNA-binding protein